jgi:hypothetical protein
MSHKHFGAAIAIAGLLMACPIALGEVEEGSHVRTEFSGYGGWGRFAAPIRVLDADSSEVADGNAGDSRDTHSPPFENEPVNEFNIYIPPTTRSSVISNSPAGDPLYLQSTFEGNSDNIGTLPGTAARRSISTPPGSSRALTLVSHAKSTLPPAGCVRCVGQIARASAGGTKSLAALFSRNFFRKGGPVQPRRLVSGNVRLRNPPLLTASTIQRSWLTPSL